MRSGFEQDRAARFGAEDAARVGYETDESSRLRQQEIYTSMAPGSRFKRANSRRFNVNRRSKKED